MIQFHTCAGLIEHLRYKGKKRTCLENVYIVMSAYSHEQTVETISSDALLAKNLNRAGYRRTKAQAPAYRVAGPLRRDRVNTK